MSSWWTQSLEVLEEALERAIVPERSHHVAFARACFGYEQALESWPDNPRAHQGLALATSRR